MKSKTIYLLLIISVLMANCKNSHSKKEITKPSEQVLIEGYQLTENQCFSCHSPNGSLEDRIAPSMDEIKKHYINAKSTPDQFTQDLSAFMNNPGEELSKMPDAIEQFGLMPKIDLSEEQISKIATYIYFSELKKPEWFEKQSQEYQNRSALAIETGQNIASQTQGILGKNLMAAIQSKGTEHALSFCSIKAIPLTDSMAIALNTKIKRVSDKNRNPENKANEAELAYIAAAKLAISKGEKPKPQLTIVGEKQIGYYPIMTNKMCMQCHGQPETEVLPNTLSKIHQLYPNDLAMGYKLNELRGIWVIEMNTK